MNILKVQQDVLKALCKEERVIYYRTDDDGVFISVSGVHGWIIPEELLRVNLTGAQLFTDLGLERLFRDENKLIGTDEYRRGGIARRYKTPHSSLSSVYVDTKLLKYFDAPTLYQGESALGPIAVVEQPIDGEPQIVGMVMPVRVRDDDLD